MALWKKVIIGLVTGILLGSILRDYPKCLAIAEIVGEMFLRSLKMLMGPLIFFTLVKGIISFSSASSLGKMGIKIVSISLLTTAFAVVFGLGVAAVLRPGEGIGAFEAPPGAPAYREFHFKSFIAGIVPENAFQAFSQGNLLQIVFFSIFSGIVINQFKQSSENLEKSISFISRMVFEMVSIIVKVSPYGICALMACTVAQQGLNVMLSMTKLVIAVSIAMSLQYLIFGLLILLFCKSSPLPFYRKSLPYQLLALSTCSTKAVLPTTIKICTEELGISDSSASVMLPISAAVNMNGSAIGLGVSAIFFAQMYSVPLAFPEYLTIVLTSTIGAIGGAGIPGASIIMLPMVLQSAHIPTEGVAILASVDRILDMLRTTINVTGDATMTLLVDRSEGNWDKKRYYS